MWGENILLLFLYVKEGEIGMKAKNLTGICFQNKLPRNIGFFEKKLRIKQQG
jgi:hypothetical protein